MEFLNEIVDPTFELLRIRARQDAGLVLFCGSSPIQAIQLGVVELAFDGLDHLFENRLHLVLAQAVGREVLPRHETTSSLTNHYETGQKP